MVGGYSKPEKGDQGIRLVDTGIRDTVLAYKFFDMKWLLFSVLIFLAACSTRKEEHNQEVANIQPVVNDMPALPVTLLDSTQIIVRELPGNTILVFSLSDCDHCQREADVIKENLAAFKNYTLYFLSHEPAATQMAFAETHGLAGEPNVKFGKVAVNMIIRNFGAIPTPSMYIYAEGKNLVKQFNGETPIEDIMAVL